MHGSGDHADGGRLRPRARGSHPGAAEGEAAAAAVHAASWPRWCATRSAIAVRAFVTFGAPIPARRLRPAVARRSCSTWRRLVRARDRPALQGAADRALRGRDAAVDHAAGARSAGSTSMLDTLRATGAPTSPSRAAARPSRRRAEPFQARGIIVDRRRPVPRARAQRAALLRRTHQHLLTPRRLARTDARRPRRRPCFISWPESDLLKRLASRYGMRSARRLRPPLHRRRDRSRRRSPPARPLAGRGPAADARLSRRERRHDGRGGRGHARLPQDPAARSRVGHRAQRLAEADAARPRRRPRDLRRQPAAHPRPRRRARVLRPHRHGELRRTPTARSQVFETHLAAGLHATSASCCSRA